MLVFRGGVSNTFAFLKINTREKSNKNTRRCRLICSKTYIPHQPRKKGNIQRNIN